MKEGDQLHVILGFTIAEWGTIVVIASAIIGFLNKILKDNVKTPLKEVRNELVDIRQQESKKHEQMDENVNKIDGRVTRVEVRVDNLEKRKEKYI